MSVPIGWGETEYKRRCLNCNFARKTKNTNEENDFEKLVCSYCGAPFNFFIRVYS